MQHGELLRVSHASVKHSGLMHLMTRRVSFEQLMYVQARKGHLHISREERPMTVQPMEFRIPQWEMKDRLRKAREDAGYEIGELADALGATRHTISRAEKGLTTPRRSLLIAWAWQTRVPVEWLETGKAPSHDDDGAPVRSSGQWAPRDSNPEPAD
ncbi:helix-turn-helix transcriptional regulator [Nesterenkonia rhizosphaerae]|uniref:helix-turn-helix transcriptional regulator n=1 Tax=Nesterenkonia rhizosphaerae TaxID=1348272 RepID=UPI003CD069E9